jgi:dTDP-4-dehydrorhamnose reductase
MSNNVEICCKNAQGKQCVQGGYPVKIALCGAGGMLATDLIEVCQQQGHEITGLTIDDLDITKISDVRTKLTELKPDAIINAAAFTNVDGCEANPDVAYQVNCVGPRNLAIVAEELGAALVHVSTDYVFGGTGTEPYREYDSVNPKSVYGKSKLDGEIMVRSLCHRHFIVRTAWLFGIHGNNFVRTMLKLAKDRDVLEVVNDQLGSPTYSLDLATAIASLLAASTYGTYHITNSGQCTWYDFTREILRQSGNAHVRVEPMTTEQLNRPADRPRYSVMDNFMWRMDGHIPLRSYQEALADYLVKENKRVN